MRCDQYIGLTDAAEKFLEENKIPNKVCPCCGRVIPKIPKIIGKCLGMFGTTCPLFRHRLKDGRTADEYLQASPWSSGPMFFIGLKVSDGKEFNWPQEEIDNVI